MNERRTVRVFLSMVVLASAFLLAGSAAAQESLRDIAAQEGFDRLAGRWTASGEQGEIKLAYKWQLNGHLAVVTFSMGEYEYRGMIFYVPEEQRAVEVGVDNRGGRAKGAWEPDDGALVSTSTRTNADGSSQTLAMVHSMADARTLKIAVYAVDENGQRASEPWSTLEFKRARSKKAKPAAQGALKALQGTWVGEEQGGRGGAWTLTVSNNKLTAEGPAPESYEGTVKVNAAVDPKQVDVKITTCSASQFVGAVTHGLYKVEGDTLTIVACMPGSPDRPTAFERGNGARMFVYKRKK